MRFQQHFAFLAIFLMLGCVPLETDFISPVPVASEATQIDYTSFSANWEASLGVEEFILEVAYDAEFNDMLVGFPTQVNAQSKLVEGLYDGETYYYRLKGVFNGSNTEYSNTVSVTTTSFFGSHPMGLTVTQNGPTSFSIKWDKVTDAAGYIVNLALDPAFNNPVSSYYEVDAGDVDSLNFEGLDPDTQYYVRLNSYIHSSGAGGVKILSADSDILVNQTLRPFAPIVTDASGVTPLRFTANWEPVPDVDFYILDVATDDNFTSFVDGYEEKPVIDTSIELEGLEFNEDYYYRVKARVKGIFSDYSETQKVESSLHPNCRIKRIYYNRSNATVLTYDGQLRLSKIVSRDRYGTTKTFNIKYRSSSDKLPYVSYNTFNGGTQRDTTHFIFNTDGKIESMTLSGPANVQRFTYEYNSQGWLTDYDGTIQYPGNPTKYFLVRHDYTHDDEGNVLTLTGREYYFTIPGYRNLNWSFKYDEKINPFALLPDYFAKLLPFTLNYDRHTSHVPYFPKRNIIFADFGSSFQEIVAYDYSDKEVATKQLGFFTITYEFKNCD